MLTTYKPEPVFTFIFASPSGEQFSENTTTHELALMKVASRALCSCGKLILLPTPIANRFDWEMKMIDRGIVPAATSYYPE